MHICSYICRLPEQTSEEGWLSSGTCHLYPCSVEAHPKSSATLGQCWHHVLCSLTPRTYGHVLHCKYRHITKCSGYDCMPVMPWLQRAPLLDSPQGCYTFQTTCLQITQSSVSCQGSSYEDLMTFKVTSFPGFVCHLIFTVSNLLERPPHPLFHEFKPFS